MRVEFKGKPKRKRKAQRLSVDFVTALTVAECRDRLERKTARMAPDWQRIFLRDDDSFILERQVEIPVLAQLRNERAVEVRFRGALEAVEDGTRVTGVITEDTLERYHLENWGLVVVAVVVAALVAIPLLIGEQLIFLGALALATLVIAMLFWRWNTIKWYPIDLVNWVRKELHVPLPEKDELDVD